ncbi:MAG: hypothetical protein GOVbin7015_16 [Prokaryotic dsDNA virus sp.]|nr:MAG: hypothetical protein GOVbin7015_16 [Prokaryotic dsDNA virus sp.]
MIAAAVAGTGSSILQGQQSANQARRGRQAQGAAASKAESAAMSREREEGMRMRRANRRKPNPVAGMASNKGVGGTTMTGPMGLGATTLGGGGGPA